MACSVGTEAVYFRNSDGSLINLVPDDEVANSYVPNIRISDFKESLKKFKPPVSGPPVFELLQQLASLNAHKTLISTIDLKNKKGLWIIADQDLLPQDKGIVGVCGERVKKPHKWLHGTLFMADSIELVSR